MCSRDSGVAGPDVVVSRRWPLTIFHPHSRIQGIFIPIMQHLMIDKTRIECSLAAVGV